METHGTLGGETRLMCMFGFGTVVDDAVQWKKGEDNIQDVGKYDISRRDGDTFTLAIQDTAVADIGVQYACEYGDQSATYILSTDDIEGAKFI